MVSIHLVTAMGYEMKHYHLQISCPWCCYIGSALRSADRAVCDFRMKSRVEGKKCNRIRYIYHFLRVAVEVNFYGDIQRVVGFATQLSNVHRGMYLDGQPLDLVAYPAFATHMYKILNYWGKFLLIISSENIDSQMLAFHRITKQNRHIF